jgi:hypothetical protein
LGPLFVFLVLDAKLVKLIKLIVLLVSRELIWFLVEMNVLLIVAMNSMEMMLTNYVKSVMFSVSNAQDLLNTSVSLVIQGHF